MQAVGKSLDAVDRQAVGASANATVSGSAASNTKDAKEASTEPKFGDLLNNIQAKYGAKDEKPREIKKTLGKDDFLRIMITQMRHQDPTNPFKAEQMAAQMAQFTSVEQLQNVNQNLAKLANQNQPMERMAMTNLIGKLVTVDRDRFPHTEGTHEPLNFNLPQAAESCHISIVNDAGETMLEKDLGALKAGENSFAWDGKKSNTLPAKSGNYILRIDAKNEKGSPIQTSTLSRSRVIGVSFEGSEPVLLVGDANKQDKITMRNVIKIESDGMMATAGGGSLIPGAQPLSGAATNAVPGGLQPPKANMFSFKKGEGSANLDTSQLGPEAQAALGRFQEAQAQAQAQASAPGPAKGQAPGPAHEKPMQTANNKPEEKGFPNGLHD